MAKRPYIPECTHVSAYEPDCVNCLYKDVFHGDADDILYDDLDSLEELLKYEED